MQRRNVVGLLQTACLLGVLTSIPLTAGPLDNWKWRNPLPNATKMRAVAYVGGLFVGVGDWGTIMTSTNLTTDWWVPSPLGTNTSTLRAIAYANNTFVIAASDSWDGDKTKRFYTSTDATNWYIQTWTNADTRAVNGLAYGAGLFVAVCERAQVWTSPDGTNWTQRVSPYSNNKNYNLNAVTYNPTFGFVAVGDSYNSGPGEIATSPDGIDWALQTSGVPAYTLNAVTWGCITNLDSSITTNFVAVGSSGTIITSWDGTNWGSQSSYTTAKLAGAAYSPDSGSFIAVGPGAVIQTSVDGTNWVASWSDLSLPGNDFLGATYAQGYFTAVGYYGEVETSPTGVGGTWTGRFGGRTENFYGIARGSVNFVVVGGVNPTPPPKTTILTSWNGVSWQIRNPGIAVQLNNVAYGVGNFVAVGNSGTIVTSANEGTNWTVQGSGTTVNTLNGVSYITNSVTNIFLATGAAGTILTSPDGTNWTSQASGIGTDLSCAAYGGDTYLVAGASGVILKSSDCTTWSAVTSGTTRAINGIVYNATNFPNNFVAVGAYGGIRTSPDGTTWTTRSTSFGTGSGVTFYTVTYVGGQFRVGANTTPPILTSTDGVTWAGQFSPSSSGFKAMAYAPDTLVGVGNGGMVLQAGALLGPLIHYSEMGGTLTLTWPGGGTLQASSPDVAGPYTNVPGAVSPWPITPMSDPSTFFRVQVP